MNADTADGDATRHFEVSIEADIDAGVEDRLAREAQEAGAAPDEYIQALIVRLVGQAMGVLRAHEAKEHLGVPDTLPALRQSEEGRIVEDLRRQIAEGARHLRITLLDGTYRAAVPTRDMKLLPPELRGAELRRWLASQRTDTPVIPLEELSRERMYEDER